MKIQRKHLELIATVDSSDSLAEVAAALHLTPSALSHQLRELESKIGSEVVRRKQRPINLSAVGQRILATAQEVLPRLAALEDALLRVCAGETGRLHLAIECHSCYLWLMPTFDAYRKNWPDVELDIVSGLSFEGMSALVAGDLDLVITADPVPLAGVTYVPLFDYESILAVKPDHRLASAETIEPADFVSETVITYPVPRQKLDLFRLFLDPAGVEPARVRTSELTVMMMALVASGRGVCSLPNWAATEYTERGSITTRRMGEGVFNTLCAAVRDEAVDLPFMRDFLLMAKDTPFSSLQGIARPVGSERTRIDQ